MCGIGGIWGGVLRDPGPAARVLAEQLAHRGPDGQGFLGIPAGGEPTKYATAAEVYHASTLTGLLVHRRLSIIDLATGHQPMALPGKTIWIVFNGEIYNYRELRDELASMECEPFCTTSDTEVILRAYRRWGMQGFRRLNGIFAFAIYDASRRVLVLARDPIGVKPLYWCRADAGIAFASEMRPLQALGFVGRGLHPEALAQYLHYRFVPAPNTLWKEVRKVPPGSALEFDAEAVLRREAYFAEPPLARHAASPSIPSEAAERFLATVDRQMLADVPVGAFLSGGFDSSLVVRGMSRAKGEIASFAIGFPDLPGKPSELAAAATAATILHTRHKGITTSAEDYFPRLAGAIAQVEEPVAHPGMLLQADLAAAASREVKVVLTGQGADEPMGGYTRHQAVRFAFQSGSLGGALARLLLQRTSLGSREQLGRLLQSLSEREASARLAASFNSCSLRDTAAAVRGYSPAAGVEAIEHTTESWWGRSEGADPVARALFVDVRTSLTDDLLLVADKTGMAAGLEVRVPFLDLEYLRFLESLPGNYRVRLWGSRKWLQREIGRRLLPAELWRRLAPSTMPWLRKRGFDVPVHQWLRRDLGPDLLALVLGPNSMTPSYIDPAYVRPVLEGYLAARPGGYRQPLALLALELWLRTQVRGDQPEVILST